MDPLIEGYRRFRADVWPAERARYEALAHWGQSPEAMVIACSDSRVDPQTMFGAVPGELFVVRNVAALVPPYSPDPGHHGTSAALEFGVRVLKIPRLVVLGHGQCGGVKAMAYGPPPQAQDFIASWVEIGKPALDAAGDKPEGRLERIEAEVVRLSLANLMTFPWIAEAVAAGRLALEGYWFDVHTGVLASVGPDGLEPVDEGGRVTGPHGNKAWEAQVHGLDGPIDWVGRAVGRQRRVVFDGIVGSSNFSARVSISASGRDRRSLGLRVVKSRRSSKAPQSDPCSTGSMARWWLCRPLRIVLRYSMI